MIFMNDTSSIKENFTLKGLKIVTIAYLISFLATVLNLILRTSDNRSFIAINSILGIIFLLSLAFIYYGFKFIYRGNKDFSKEHEKSTLIARKLIIFGVIFYLFAL
jgi:hypothetical protein